MNASRFKRPRVGWTSTDGSEREREREIGQFEKSSDEEIKEGNAPRNASEHSQLILVQRVANPRSSLPTSYGKKPSC